MSSTIRVGLLGKENLRGSWTRTGTHDVSQCITDELISSFRITIINRDWRGTNPVQSEIPIGSLSYTM